ncbi:MAG TPA: MBL fold metallo-hydrolase [Acidimicrobiales bacterium]|nr:MBL fold metallo-hydrolase [Acidimicrobiales bacterium]
MITVTGTAQRTAWELGVLPPVEQVRPGLWSIPVPIPINPLRYVLVYAFELAGGGVALVDAGWDTDEAWNALIDGHAMLGASIGDVRAVVVTHIHPDHYGLAGKVREASGAWVALHPADAGLLHERYVDVEGLMASMRTLLALSGVPAETLPDLTEASMQVRTFVSMAPPDVLLEDRQAIDAPGWDLRAIWTPGHSPGHVCLYSEDRRLLLSGDHVLPRITPNISFHSQQVANPLGDYLESLARLRHLEPDEVLPAHEYRFSDLGARLTEIEQHHAARLAAIEAAIVARPGSTAWELTTSLTWSRPWADVPPYMRRAANGETLAHLVLLERRGQVRREPGTPARFYPDEGRPGGATGPSGSVGPSGASGSEEGPSG